MGVGKSNKVYRIYARLQVSFVITITVRTNYTNLGQLNLFYKSTRDAFHFCEEISTVSTIFTFFTL